MNQNYGDVLQFLQGLLGNQQSTNASQFQQGLTAQQSEYMANLANQLANTQAQGQNAINLQAPQLALQGKEFDTTTKNALQQQLWQQQFAQDQNAQQQNAQRLAQLQSDVQWQAQQPDYPAQQRIMMDQAAREGWSMSPQSFMDLARTSKGTLPVGVAALKLQR